MFTMDFKYKGMTWVGTVYQRFETMCQEVEDTMCQETAKYVESQVQNVGASVKKFYAEVMQDLLPPSSLGSVKDNTLGLSMGKTAHFGTYEKSKVPFEDNHIMESPNAQKVLGKTTKDLVEQSIYKSSKACFTEDTAKEMLPPLNMSETTTPAEKHLSEAKPLGKFHDINHSLPSSSLDPIKREDSKISLEQNDGVGMHKMPCVPIGPMKEKLNAHKASEKTATVMEDSCQKRIVHKMSKAVPEENSAKEKPAPFTAYDVTAPAGKDSSPASSLIKLHSLPSSSQDSIIGVDPRLSMEQRNDAGTFNNMDITDAPLNEMQALSEVSNLITPAGKGPGQATSFGELPNDMHEEGCNTVMNLSNRTSVEPLVCNCHEERDINGCDVMVEHISDNSGTGMSTIIDSSWNGLEDQSECADLDTYMAQLETEITGRSDDSGVDEGTDPVEQRNETAKEFCNANLEESCIFVDSQELSFVPHRPGKHRSYKKKIHDALASRLRSAKKQEYEQLAIWCRGIDGREKAEYPTTSTLTDLNLRNLPTQDLHESEWELL